MQSPSILGGKVFFEMFTRYGAAIASCEKAQRWEVATWKRRKPNADFLCVCVFSMVMCIHIGDVKYRKSKIHIMSGPNLAPHLAKYAKMLK